jgi:hypothetical protein
MEPEQIEDQVRGSLASRMLAELDPILSAEETSIESRAYRLLDDGLDPTLAVQLWAQKWAINSLRKRLRGLVRKGEAAGKKASLSL